VHVQQTHSFLAAANDPPADYSEAHLRRDLAAAYRLAAHFGWDDLVGNHFSARVPGKETFLLNPYGLTFDEVTASSLVEVDLEGNIVSASNYGINPAGFVIHSAIHQGRADAVCVMHLHSQNSVAISSTEAGLLPLNQTAITVCADLTYHDYEGIAVNLEERGRLQSNLGAKHTMLLRNHGSLTVGASVASAFYRMYMLEWSCEVQVRTAALGGALRRPPQEVVDANLGLISGEFMEKHSVGVAWPALLRKADKLFPDYAD
jgi:ribulose-5-phosphate 4-epimerase/fuculose-1-phosphate aldolase